MGIKVMTSLDLDLDGIYAFAGNPATTKEKLQFAAQALGIDTTGTKSSLSARIRSHIRVIA
jgi:hypothetical protein